MRTDTDCCIEKINYATPFIKKTLIDAELNIKVAAPVTVQLNYRILLGKCRNSFR